MFLVQPGVNWAEDPEDVRQLWSCSGVMYLQKQSLIRNWHSCLFYLLISRLLGETFPWSGVKYCSCVSNWFPFFLFSPLVCLVHIEHWLFHLRRYIPFKVLLSLCTELKCTNSTVFSLELLLHLKLHYQLWVNSVSFKWTMCVHLVSTKHKQ